MVKFTWGNICSSSSIDVNSNNISLFNIIEQVNLLPDVVFPVTAQNPIQLIFSLRRENELLENKNFDVRIDLVGPNEIVIESFPLTITFEKDKNKMRGVVEVMNLKMSSSGVHRFVIVEVDTSNILGEVSYEVFTKPN